MNKRNKKLNHAEAGIMSIIVTMIIAIVLSLIVMGFSQLSRREQRQTLDRQLSTQAFYAAEAGINDVIAGYNTNWGDKTDCSFSGNYATTPFNSGQIDSETSYTCLLINASVDDIVLNPLVSGTIVPIRNPGLISLEIGWENAGNGTAFNTNQYPNFPPLTHTDSSKKWQGNANALEITIIPLNGLTRPSLITNSYTAFLYPQNEPANGIASYNPTIYSNINEQGSILKANCHANNTPDCRIKFSSLPGNNTNGYAIRLKTVYSTNNLPVNVTIKGENISGPIKFVGSQMIIDVTGKAKDVLRRVQVRRPISSSGYGNVPLSALESSDSLCKQIAVAPPNIVNDVFGPSGGVCPSFDY